MKKMQIFEPAMCCSTGLCGVGVDPELLRISTVLNTLDKKGVKVERYNLSGSPQMFVINKAINTATSIKINMLAVIFPLVIFNLLILIANSDWQFSGKDINKYLLIKLTIFKIIFLTPNFDKF
jgi:hypothetical protein